jgi:hypothetical protein
MDINEIVLREVGPAIREAVLKKLTDFNSPLNGIVDQVVARHSLEIQNKIDFALKEAIASVDFDAAIRENLTHKLARILSSKMEGAVEKVANDIRSNPVFKSRLTIAVEQILRDLSNQINK